jgi:hypothetical protein
MGVRFDSLDMVTGAGGPLEEVTAVPLKGAITPTDLTTWADLIASPTKIADFTGSDPILIVWSNPALGANRQPFKESQLLLWICSATPAPAQTIYGVAYYLAGSPNVLLGIDLFDAPILVDEEFDSVQWICTAP